MEMAKEAAEAESYAVCSRTVIIYLIFILKIHRIDFHADSDRFKISIVDWNEGIISSSHVRRPHMHVFSLYRSSNVSNMEKLGQFRWFSHHKNLNILKSRS